ncbi:DNA cytosine methyltransferase [Rossellomorea vietnamensis]|uniref:Cytosine-specific methyltransferase n=1 Tax=Rossellomorea vietnamensis TaxID=218284 RepID=A0A5D4K5U1_9BACI|nr:DNA cytosine methyltransferase [Rossellomorea vietnamensis]TYR72592.1 DNA cytosine methyltransferase [Rossellomorea vietnamensis]
MNDKKYKVVSLFAGAGGMDLGFKNAGFDIVWANDFNQYAVETYKHNFGSDHVVLGDITQVPSSDIPDGVDVVIGGFPCQGFSVANTRRNMEDKRNFLYLELLRVVRDKQPKFFVAENVKGLLSMGKGQVIELIKSDFEKIGYKVDYKVLNSADYGVPQARERVIIMGNRLGLENVFPVETHGPAIQEDETGQVEADLFKEAETQKNLIPYITVEEAIGHLSDVRTRNEPFVFNGQTIFNHVAAENVSDKFWGRKHKVNQEEVCDYLKYWREKAMISVKKIDEHFGYRHTAGHWFRKDNKSGSIPKPEDWWVLKKLLKFDDTFDKQVTEFIEKEIKFEQSLRITNWDRPSDTITASQPEIHVNKKRRLSVRECAILQSFPNDFEFLGSMNAMYTQVGNAVPVLLAEKIGLCVRDSILQHMHKAKEDANELLVVNS